MSQNDRITPVGTRDLLFEECEAVKRVEQRLGGLFSSRGFQEVRTPGIEFLDVFQKPGAAFPQESMYALTDRKGRLMVMRPDSTMPIARLVSTRLRNAALPLRLYYTQPVYRAGSRLNGRSDEVIQTGIELLGCGGARADLEVLSLAADTLLSCGGRFRLEVGHVGIFRELVATLPVTDDIRDEICTLTENKNYPMLNDLLDGIDSPSARLLKRLPRLFGGAETLQEAEQLFADLPTIRPLVSGLRALYDGLCAVVGSESIALDLGLVQPSAYYTGVVFTGYLEGRGEQVLSGGRYDRLLEAFGYPCSAVGFGVDVDAVARLHLNESTAETPSMLIHGLPGFFPKALRFAREAAESGRVCEHSLFDATSDAVAYAARRGIPTVAEVGQSVTYISTREGEEA